MNNSLFKQIYYLISFRCNQFCSKCHHWKKEQSVEVLDPTLISNALKALAPIDEFCIVGGEPLLFPDSIANILSATTNLPHRTVIVTNGVLLSKDLVDNLLRYRIHIVVSVDTLDRDFWRYVRGIDSYDLVMENLDYAYRMLSPEQLSVQSVAAKETKLHLSAVKAFCAERGLHHSIQDYVQDGFEGEWNALDSSESQHPSALAKKCFAAGRNLSIDSKGNVTTCFQQYLILGCEKPIGNLKFDSIENIINSAYSDKVQMAMQECALPCRVLKCNQELS